MYNLDRFISNSVTIRSVSMYKTDIEADKESRQMKPWGRIPNRGYEKEERYMN